MRPVLLLAAVAVIVACSRQEPPRVVRVGAQEVSVRLPAGWEVREEPAAAVLSAPAKGQSTPMAVYLRDLGPVTPAAYRRELAAVAGLWEARKGDAATAQLGALRWPTELFPSLAGNADFAEAWAGIARAGPGTVFADVKSDFETVDRILDATPPLAPGALTAWALAHVDSGARREVGARRKVTVGGRDGEEIETRDTLAQGLPRRALFVQNDGRMLVVSTGIVGRDTEVERYEAIRNSLAFPAK